MVADARAASKVTPRVPTLFTAGCAHLPRFIGTDRTRALDCWGTDAGARRVAWTRPAAPASGHHDAGRAYNGRTACGGPSGSARPRVSGFAAPALSSEPRMIRAVLFDFYDTLAHVRGDAVRAARREIARRAGLDEAAMAALWRDTAAERMLGTMGTLEQQIDTLLRQLGRVVPASQLRELAAIDLRAWTDGVVLYPDARPALETLKARGYRLGVLSN